MATNLASFDLYLTASDADRSAITSFLTNKLQDQPDVFHVVEFPATLEQLEAMAIEIARLAPHTSFTMDGSIDTGYGAIPFSLEYATGILTSSGDEEDEFDAICIEDRYSDYEEFCDDFWDEENECPLYTEEEYEEFCSWMPAFIVGNRIFENEPAMGATRKYRITPDAVIPESSGDDWDDDEDFEDED